MIFLKLMNMLLFLKILFNYTDNRFSDFTSKNAKHLQVAASV